MPVLVQHHPKIATRTETGQTNGWLVPVFSVHDGVVDAAQHPRQVYLAVIARRAVKGPHLHLKRWGLFTCIRGNARIVVRTESGYEEYLTGEDHGFATVQVPAGSPAALQNLGEDDAYVLNMPSPAWKVDDQDEHPVSFDDYTFRWP